MPPSPPSTVMKSGVLPVFTIALQMPRNSRRFPMHNLKPTGLPSESSRSLATNSSNSTGVEKNRVRRRRQDIFTHWHSANFSDFLCQLSSRRNTSVSRFRALVKFDLYRFDGLHIGSIGKCIRTEFSVRGTATKVTRADLPDQIALSLSDSTAFTGIVGEISYLSSLIPPVTIKKITAY